MIKRWEDGQETTKSKKTKPHFSPALFQAFYGILDASLIEALSRFHFFGRKLSSFLGDDQVCVKKRWNNKHDILHLIFWPCLCFCCMLQGIYSAVYCLVALNCMVSLQNNPRGLRTLRIPWIDRNWDTKWMISQANQLGAPHFILFSMETPYAVWTTSSGIWICNEIRINEHSHELERGHLRVNFRGHPQLSHGNMKEVVLNCGDTRNFLISAENQPCTKVGTFCFNLDCTHPTEGISSFHWQSAL